MPDQKHLAAIAEANRHPLNQAALKWLEVGEEQYDDLAPGQYQLHAMNLLMWSIQAKNNLTKELR